MLRHSFSPPAGRTIIQRIEQQMDKRRKAMDDLYNKGKVNPSQQIARDYLQNKGRYEGLAAALALLRSTSVPEEISRSNDRLGLDL